jgi:uncharacterized protein (TIGR02594 family)
MQVPKSLNKTPWLAAGYHELLAGVGRMGSVDVHGKALLAHDTEGHILNNPRILEYFAATQHNGKGHWTESNSWCSAFVNWCVRQSGITGTRSAMARSWLHWHQGEKLDQPRVGAVVVFPRPPNPQQGHVAMVWSIRDDHLEVLGGNQGAHAAGHHKAGVSSHVSIANRKASTALGFFWPRSFPYPDAGSQTGSGELAGTMLILRGIAGHYAGRDWPRGALDEPPALEYARRRSYQGRVLDVAGATGTHSRQTVMALDAFRRDESITALYGFSGGGYNVLHVIRGLTSAERARLRLVVVLGAPKSPEHSYKGSWELVYRLDPPDGHMAGPRALLGSLH